MDSLQKEMIECREKRNKTDQIRQIAQSILRSIDKKKDLIPLRAEIQSAVINENEDLLRTNLNKVDPEQEIALFNLLNEFPEIPWDTLMAAFNVGCSLENLFDIELEAPKEGRDLKELLEEVLKRLNFEMSDKKTFIDNKGLINMFHWGDQVPKEFIDETYDVTNFVRKEELMADILIKRFSGQRVKSIYSPAGNDWFLQIIPEGDAGQDDKVETTEENPTNGRDPIVFLNSIFVGSSTRLQNHWRWEIDSSDTYVNMEYGFWEHMEFDEELPEETFSQLDWKEEKIGLDKLFETLKNKRIKSVRGSNGMWYLRIV